MKFYMVSWHNKLGGYWGNSSRNKISLNVSARTKTCNIPPDFRFLCTTNGGTQMYIFLWRLYLWNKNGKEERFFCRLNWLHLHLPLSATSFPLYVYYFHFLWKKIVPALPLYVNASSVFFLLCVNNCCPMLQLQWYFHKTFRHLFTALKESKISHMLYANFDFTVYPRSL